MNNPVNHPVHYTSHPSGVECIDVVERMPFCEGNAIKYLWRAGLKGDRLEDLRKAEWYVKRAIALAEKERPASSAPDEVEHLPDGSVLRNGLWYPDARPWIECDGLVCPAGIRDLKGGEFCLLYRIQRQSREYACDCFIDAQLAAIELRHFNHEYDIVAVLDLRGERKANAPIGEASQ
ncbi:DUF3310 domain-containing protein [Acuticoccus sp. M5D2P5]|uniref:DUF3310 domain-containing protein n=1 Tax=Acuticoccus kalidii TaxID=2910977 RepID=UPI001F43EB93|nr:DUF3310 domain-containing protein [Acuticoccus kalidii]